MVSDITASLSQQIKETTIAQSDHDMITRLTVLVETMLVKMTGLELQIKEATVNQQAALATWEAKSTLIHETQDTRIRTLESALAKYVPEYVDKIDKQEKIVQDLQENRSYVLGGWRAIVIIIVTITWLIGISIAITNISLHLH